MQKELSWIAEAKKYNGLREIVGVKHNPTIVQWLKNLGAWWRDDETPWCGVFVAHCLTASNRAIPKHWYRAKAYAEYGTLLKRPAYGCIGVMGRSGGGHVCFIVGETKDGYLVGLGGNQSNSVGLAKFPRSRFIAFVWPPYGNGVPSLPYDSRYKLPIYDSSLKVSASEA